MRTTRYSEPSDAEFERAMEHTRGSEDETAEDEEPDEEGEEEQLACMEHP